MAGSALRSLFREADLQVLWAQIISDYLFSNRSAVPSTEPREKKTCRPGLKKLRRIPLNSMEGLKAAERKRSNEPSPPINRADGDRDLLSSQMASARARAGRAHVT